MKKTKTSARRESAKVYRLQFDCPDSLHLDFVRLAIALGLTVGQAHRFIMQWAVNQNNITPDLPEAGEEWKES
jgi:hypothetical protein